MSWPLAIEAEARAVMSDFHNTAIEFAVGRGRAVDLADGNRTWVFVCGMQRVLREQVQNIRS